MAAFLLSQEAIGAESTVSSICIGYTVLSRKAQVKSDITASLAEQV